MTLSERCTKNVLILWLALIVLAAGHIGADAQERLFGEFQWRLGPPVLAPAVRPDDPCYSVKDPSVVFYEGRWHLFCTIRSQKRSHQIEYVTFRDWSEARRAKHHILRLTDGYFCAPQVFYYRPHRRWYLVYQVIDQSRKPALQPAFSTTEKLADPGSWTTPQLLFKHPPDNVKRWIDFWVICDGKRAHLFFTSLDGKMWRAETTRDRFPHGWSRPEVVLQADIFEAAHIYRLKGRDQFLAIIEAQTHGRSYWRYYKAFLVDRLDGRWKPLAASHERPFASPINVQETAEHWTDNISHGELLRAGYDERLLVDPDRLRLLFQGVTNQARRGKPYGQIPWKLGLLEPASVGGSDRR
ncbi:MAG: hypothetical protein GXP27_05090 [Planctomycetes bacterium]|nr:hypothetical protein [Planctomycetota bacterium]